MARPRVFVSSTFYDLQHIRSDVELFIRSFAFDPVMFEKGAIPWREDKTREEQCYAEVSRCDIVVSIIGNSFGTEATLHSGSISHNEMRRAVADGKQVYAFILADVDAKYDVYKRNKNRPAAADFDYGVDRRALEFIDEVRSIPSLGIQRFTTASDITGHLREQWSGLFHELLSTREQVRQQRMLNRIDELGTKMEETLKTYGQMYRGIWGFAHPGMAQIRELLGIGYQAFVINLRECDALLRSFGFSRAHPDNEKEGYLQWRGPMGELSIRDKTLFADNGMLVIPTAIWDKENILFERTESDDDDLPF